MIGKIERAIPTYLRTHRGDRSCIANIHRRLQERDISVQHARPMCNLSHFLPASMHVARGFKVLVAAALGERERGEGREGKQGFWHGQEHLAPCDRFDPERGALMAIVCRRHTLLAISSESSAGE